MPLTSLMIAAAVVATPTPPDLTRSIAETQRFARREGEALWRGYGAAPFEMLLIEDARETLFCPAAERGGFAPDGVDPVTRCRRLMRPRSTLPNTLLAAMPMFGPPATIFMGTPATTGRSPADWSRTILHEHFHQWQANLPDYYARVAALDLAGDDTTGMWMLNFAFPYDAPAVGARYHAASIALADALAARGTPDFGRRVAAFATARAAFAGAAGERAWRYLDFQLWQEGVARWTEIALGARYRDPAARAAAKALEERTLATLRTPDLAGQRRLLAYPYGAGEAMLIAACDPTWRTRYPALLGLTPLVDRAVARCSRA